MSMESIYEYGSRAGVWRLLDLFRDRNVPLTLFAVDLPKSATAESGDRNRCVEQSTHRLAQVPEEDV